MQTSASEGVTVTRFTLSDQGTGSGTNGQGNFTFNTAQELDNHLLNYVQNSAYSEKASKFPAKIEIHQIQEPE